MNLSASIYAIRWLIRDTFRQAAASGITWVMLCVTALCILTCFSVGVSGPKTLQREDGTAEFMPSSSPGVDPEGAAKAGVDLAGGEMTLAFGAMHVPMGRDVRDGVRFLQLILAGGVADAAGVLLALIWTAGFLPSFLEPGAASVLLAKPAPRWSLLTGKFIGVLTFVGSQAMLFVGGTWLALGLKTGIWDTAYLLCIPLLMLHFSIFYSVSALIAVSTRSTVACVIGSLLFWMLCWGMNYGRHSVVAIPDLQQLPGSLAWVVEAGYWLLPKPADLSLLLFDALDAGKHFGKVTTLESVQSRGAFYPGWSIATSLAFMVGMLGLAGREFLRADY
jgi:hypothetical protein